MPPLTHRGVGRPRLATYAAARAGMVAGPAVLAANHKRQLSPMPLPGGPGGQQAPGVPKRPRMMSQYRVPESGDPMRLGNPVEVRESVDSKAHVTHPITLSVQYVLYYMGSFSRIVHESARVVASQLME